MTPAQLRKFVLTLDGVEARPHMGRTAFRTTRKIFATLGDDKRVNLIIEPADKRDALLEAFPDAIHSLGGWTRLGYVAVDLAVIDDALLRELVTDAWEQAKPVAKKKRPTKKKAATGSRAASRRRG